MAKKITDFKTKDLLEEIARRVEKSNNEKNLGMLWEDTSDISINLPFFIECARVHHTLTEAYPNPYSDKDKESLQKAWNAAHELLQMGMKIEQPGNKI